MPKLLACYLNMEGGVNYLHGHECARSSLAPLHYAPNVAVAKLLIQHGADVDIVGTLHRTTLDDEIYGTDCSDELPWTPLLAALKNGHCDVAKVLIENGGNGVVSSLHHFKTPTHIHIYTANASKHTKFLGRIFSPFGMACEYGYVDFVSFLIQNKVDPPRYVTMTNDIGTGFKWYYGDKFSPLHIACMNNRVEICKLFLDSGLDVNILSLERRLSPLSASCEARHLDIIKLLIQHLREKEGETMTLLQPLAASCEAGPPRYHQIIDSVRCNSERFDSA